MFLFFFAFILPLLCTAVFLVGLYVMARILWRIVSIPVRFLRTLAQRIQAMMTRPAPRSVVYDAPTYRTPAAERAARAARVPEVTVVGRRTAH